MIKGFPNMMKAIPRVIFLLLCVFGVSLLFISRCAHEVERTTDQNGGSVPGHPMKEHYLRLLAVQDQSHRTEIAKLKTQIENLEKGLKFGHIGKISRAVKNADDETGDENDKSDNNAGNNVGNTVLKFISQKITDSEILHGVPLKTEYDIIPFDRFTLNRIYLSHPGLGKRVVERPIGYRKKDLNEVLLQALQILNENRPKDRRYSADNFVEGIYRTEPSMGTHYYFYFRDVDNPTSTAYRKVVFTRPFAPIQMVKNVVVNTEKELINIILPLSGRFATFQQFMEYFVRICVKVDKRVHLTVVYFLDDSHDKVLNLIKSVRDKYQFERITLLTLNETFSRGRGLQAGAQAWTQGDDVLIFLCDVDIIFTTDFLERCRLNAERETKVYYPIVFSLYNPKVVYSLQELVIPSPEKQLVISKTTGFWRDFGYGMTCQYRSDFLKVGGFEEKITGWGIEDVLLYRKYVKNNYMVVRATDPGVFHMWHEKVCDPNLSSEQYKSCIRSKALNEASHEHLGVLAFKDEINVHKSLQKSTPKSPKL
ncbi:chondroitin sulfate N-acetylgalactosaminyltransferase 2-like isoform X2 [Tubulanus polymorphus]